MEGEVKKFLGGQFFGGCMSVFKGGLEYISFLGEWALNFHFGGGGKHFFLGGGGGNRYCGGRGGHRMWGITFFRDQVKTKLRILN